MSHETRYEIERNQQDFVSLFVRSNCVSQRCGLVVFSVFFTGNVVFCMNFGVFGRCAQSSSIVENERFALNTIHKVVRNHDLASKPHMSRLTRTTAIDPARSVFDRNTTEHQCFCSNMRNGTAERFKTGDFLGVRKSAEKC